MTSVVHVFVLILLSWSTCTHLFVPCGFSFNNKLGQFGGLIFYSDPILPIPPLLYWAYLHSLWSIFYLSPFSFSINMNNIDNIDDFGSCLINGCFWIAVIRRLCDTFIYKLLSQCYSLFVGYNFCMGN